MKTALVCIAKNEELYIDEWIDYHHKIGFDDIIIYENNWRYNNIKKNVISIPFDGENKQMTAYHHFLKLNNKNYDWVAFFDVDEFLCLKKHKNVKDFVKEYEKFPSIGINWVLFGDNNLKKIQNDEYNILSRFLKRQKIPNKHIKSILNLKYNHEMLYVHNSILGSVDTNKNFFEGPFNYNSSIEIAQINHYFTKTKNEFIKKVERGRADTPKNIKRKLSEFDDHNFNEVEDLHAYNFFFDIN